MAKNEHTLDLIFSRFSSQTLWISWKTIISRSGGVAFGSEVTPLKYLDLVSEVKIGNHVGFI